MTKASEPSTAPALPEVSPSPDMTVYKDRALATGLLFIGSMMGLGVFFRSLDFWRSGNWAHFLAAVFFGISCAWMFGALRGLRRGAREQAAWAFFLIPVVSMLLIRAPRFTKISMDLPVTIFGPLVLLGLLAAVVVSQRAALGWCLFYTLTYVFVLGVPFLIEPSIPGPTNRKIITVCVPMLLLIAIFRVAMWSSKNARRALLASEEQRAALLETNAALLQSNADLEAARHQAQASSRAKSQFLANMSHELRTPLNAIIGYSEIVSEELEDRGEHDLIGDMNRVLSQSQHLLDMIQDLLDLSVIESGELSLHIETIDVDAFVEELTPELSALCEQKNNALKLNVDGDAKGKTFQGDPHRLRQCLLYLFDNAAKFTKDGNIAFGLAQSTSDDGTEQIVFTVEDSGIGMTEEELSQIYQPFWQADGSSTRRIGGTGLGLSLTHDLCKRMGGTLQVQSKPQEGTQITMSIPAAPNKTT